MTDKFDSLLWAYKATFTQTAGGGGAIRVIVTAQERTEILYGRVAADNYAAGRALTVQVYDGASTVAIVLESIDIDANNVGFPATGDGAAVATGNVNEFEKSIILGKGDTLQFDLASIADGKTMLLVIRALVSMAVPVVTTTGSGGTVTTTVTYDKVI